MKSKISLIAAMSENRVIGRDNALPWHLPADLKRFKELTTGHTVIMGRRTFDSVGKPLPNRRNIVISRDAKFGVDGIKVAHGLDQALKLAGNQSEVFILGGGQIFEQAIGRADCMQLTVIHANVEGDAYFPEFDESKWKLTRDERHEADKKNPLPFSFRTYERIRR